MRYRSVLTALLVVAIAAALTVPAFGQMTNDRTTQTRSTSLPQPTDTLLRADKLIGQTVVDNRGEQIGKIEEIIIDGSQKSPSYCVISTDKLSNDKRLVVVPWRAFTFSSDETEVVFEHNPQTLLQAPGFKHDQWPDMKAQGWDQNVNRYWEQAGVATSFKAEVEIPAKDMRSSSIFGRNKTKDQPGVSGSTGKPAIKTTQTFEKVSGLMGYNVNDASGARLANIESIVLDAREGKPIYCLLSYGGFLGVGQNTSVVPFKVMQINSDEKIAMLDADKRTLDATQIKSAELQLLMDDRYAQRVHSVYDTEPYWTQFGYVGEEDMRKLALSRQRSADNMYGPTRGTSGSNGIEALKPSNGQVKFNPSKSQTIHGTISSVGTITVQNETGIRLRVESDDQQAYVIYAGPREFAQEQGMRFRPGDDVKVTCSMQMIEGEQVCVAQEIETKDSTLMLFDEQGKPQFTPTSEKAAQPRTSSTRWSNGYRYDNRGASGAGQYDDYGYRTDRYQPRIPDEEYSTSVPRSQRSYNDEYGYYGDERFSRTTRTTRSAMRPMKKTDEIIGMTVRNNQNQDIGRINDVVVDTKSGRIAYAIVSYGGGRLRRGEIAAVPWTAIQLDPRSSSAYLDADEDTLREAKIDERDIERLSDPQFGRQFYRTFGEQPYWEAYGYEDDTTMRRTPTTYRERTSTTTRHRYMPSDRYSSGSDDYSNDYRRDYSR